MEKVNSYLKLLKGKYITNIEYSTGTTVAINGINEDVSKINTSIFICIYIDDYQLNIFNLVSSCPVDKSIADFVGLEVMNTYESDEEAILMFNNDEKIVIDLREEAYSDPEAMNLSGPNNFIVIWN